MKQTQWTLAVIVLAVMVFVVTFAMNYLGVVGTSHGPRDPAPPTKPIQGLAFAQRSFPTSDGMVPLELENHSKGQIDYWFSNPHEDALKVGLNRLGCKCTGVDLFVLPDSGREQLLANACALWGVAQAGPLAAGTLQPMAVAVLQKGAEGKELMRQHESVRVPSGAVGWVRLRYTAERAGPQALSPEIWFESKAGSGRTPLGLALVFHDALRVFTRRGVVDLGVLRDSDLDRGASKDIICFSSTRREMRLQARAHSYLGKPESDPFVVGKPVAMTSGELEAFRQEIGRMPAGDPDIPTGTILCAYRIPVTVHAVSADKKTPCELGTLRRRVTISSPDIDREPTNVLVTARVYGVVEIGSDEATTGINFGEFLRSKGRNAVIPLDSDTPGVELKVDQERTAKFLKATLTQTSKSADGRRSWKLRADIQPGEASGQFPRRNDPAYEDCAVYLQAHVPGKPPRTVRIPVSGTAVEG